jgi:hypothetical protein
VASSASVPTRRRRGASNTYPRDSNAPANESFREPRLCRIPIRDGHSSSHFHIGASFGVGYCP